MEKNNMTAVEWLINQLKIRGYAGEFPPHLLFEQSKQMEKEQHQETFKQSRQAKIFEDGMPPVWESFEQYYNETFSK